jgi:hypothetical protein
MKVKDQHPGCYAERLMTMTDIPTMGRQWKSFEAAVVPADAGPEQRQEMRRAFMAGAWAMFCTIENVSNASSDDAEVLVILERLRAECESFAKLVLSGDM